MKPQLNSPRTSISKLASAALLALGLLCAAPGQASAQVGVSINFFYDSLAPYGDWLYVGHYGRVWRPRVSLVGLEFRPYATGGHWVYTDYGWSFESDYDWGWAPFHYGRWLPDPDYGWVWVPGTVWAPAWVDWRYGDGYIGWAPLPPLGARVVIENYYPAWCFVHTRYFLARDFYHHAEPIDRIHVHFGATVPIRNEVSYGGARWYAGPPVTHVASAVGQPIHPVAVVPPRPGIVQPVRAGTPTMASVPASGIHGSPVSPSNSPSAIRTTPASPAPVLSGGGRPAITPRSPPTSNPHSVSPGWSQGRPVSAPLPSPSSSPQVRNPAPTPRLQPGWGAQPAPSAVVPAARVGAPQTVAPEFKSSAPAGQFIRPVPQPAPRFVPPTPVARAPQIPMNSRPIQAPQPYQSAPRFHAPAAPAARPPVSMAPSYRPSSPPVSSSGYRGGGGFTPHGGTPAGRVQLSR